MNVAPVERPSEVAAQRPLPNLPAIARVNLLLLAGLLAALIVLLWPHWRDNADLSHGFLTPLIFLLLLREARAGTPRYISGRPAPRIAQSMLLAFGVLMLCASGLYAAAVDWSHSLVAFTLTLAVTFLCAGALFSFASATVRLIPLNWTAIAAVGIWVLSAPIPPGSYSRLTLGLQLAISENVLRALHLLGIAAQRHGNIIELATTSVGVEEACSGVRSLISCVFAGVFFSATLVRSPWARAVIIGLSAPLAIGMNFARSLTLTLLANSGIDITGRWHDVTGFAVLAVTAAILAGLALLLEAQHKKRRERAAAVAAKRKPTAEPPEAFPDAKPGGTASAAPSARADTHRVRGSFQRPLAAVLVLTGALGLFFVANTRPSARQGIPAPDLLSILPAVSDGWRVHTADDLYQFSATLQTEHLAQRTYSRVTPEGVEQVTIYLAYWPAGQAPVSLVASHTPDACWPGSGWIPSRLPEATIAAAIPSRELPRPEVRLFLSGNQPQHVWFWHLYDGRPIGYRNPYSARELLNLAWKYGFSHEGDQLFVRVSSNRPWTDLAREPLVADVFSRLEPLGL